MHDLFTEFIPFKLCSTFRKNKKQIKNTKTNDSYVMTKCGLVPHVTKKTQIIQWKLPRKKKLKETIYILKNVNDTYLLL